MLNPIKNYSQLVPLMLFLIMVIYSLTYHQDTNHACKNNFAKYVSYPANGIVTKKYIDIHNHQLAILVVKNINGTETRKGTETRFTLNLDKSHLYDSVEVGYLLKKAAGDPKVRFGKTSLDKLIVLDFGCKD